MVVKTIIIA